jgi:hypothetical protein
MASFLPQSEKLWSPPTPLAGADAEVEPATRRRRGG